QVNQGRAVLPVQVGAHITGPLELDRQRSFAGAPTYEVANQQRLVRIRIIQIPVVQVIWHEGHTPTTESPDDKAWALAVAGRGLIFMSYGEGGQDLPVRRYPQRNGAPTVRDDLGLLQASQSRMARGVARWKSEIAVLHGLGEESALGRGR